MPMCDTTFERCWSVYFKKAIYKKKECYSFERNGFKSNKLIGIYLYYKKSLKSYGGGQLSHKWGEVQF